MIHVDPQNLAEQIVDILRSIARVVSCSAITHPDVEKPIGTEFDHSAVVVCKRLRDG